MSAKTCEGCPALVRDKDNQESCIYTRPFTYCPKMKPDYSCFLALAKKWRRFDNVDVDFPVAYKPCADELEALVKEMEK